MIDKKLKEAGLNDDHVKLYCYYLDKSSLCGHATGSSEQIAKEIGYTKKKIAKLKGDLMKYYKAFDYRPLIISESIYTRKERIRTCKVSVTKIL